MIFKTVSTKGKGKHCVLFLDSIRTIGDTDPLASSVTPLSSRHRAGMQTGEHQDLFPRTRVSIYEPGEEATPQN